MLRHDRVRWALLAPGLAAALLACSSPSSRVIAKPAGDVIVEKPETEAEREAKRHALAVTIVAEGSTCLPTSLKEDHAPRLEFAAVGASARVCAFDLDKTRLLGPVGCWNVALDTGALTYAEPAPLPGASVDVLLDGACARGFCVPAGTKLGDDKIAHMTWNLDGTKVAVLVGDAVHVFDTANRAHVSKFTIRGGDNGVTMEPFAIHYAGDRIFIESGQGTTSAVWEFNADGTAVGALSGPDGKPISTYHGSFSILDPDHVGVAERGFEDLTTFELGNGSHAKVTRKLAKPSCKPDEIETFWRDGDKVSDRCREGLEKDHATLMGATAVMGRTNLLVMLRGDRLGDFAVIDPKLLTEKKAIKMPWCDDTKPAAKPEAKPEKPGKPAAKPGGDDDDE